MKNYDEALPHRFDDRTDELGRTIAEQVAEIIAETIDELSLMTMGYPENRMMVDDDYDGENNPTVQMMDRWGDRYTPFHREYLGVTRRGSR